MWICNSFFILEEFLRYYCILIEKKLGGCSLKIVLLGVSFGFVFIWVWLDVKGNRSG